MMATQPTTKQLSVEAFQKAQKQLSRRQHEVLIALRWMGEGTNEEIADKISRKINTITPRVLELRKKGLVEPCGIRRKEGRSATVWRASYPRDLF